MNHQVFKVFHEQMKSAFPLFYEPENEYENIGISLCLAPLVQPDLLDNYIKENLGQEGDYPLVGGTRGIQHRGILPTGETWMFFCCQDHTAQRLHFINTLPDYLLHPSALLQIEVPAPGEPFLSGRLNFSSHFRRKFKNESIIFEQRFSKPELGGFIESSLTLDDLVLPQLVKDGIEEIRHWQHFQEHQPEKFAFTRRLKKGLKILFYGKSGTGKTQTAAILGRELGKQVYRIDLSQIVSKYIGETEKNLSKIFEAAEQMQWILFFDEGDALFGKRTALNSSNDRYANQEVAYLLQKIEDHPGIIIISTNLKENIDSAFLRRFQVITEFLMPDEVQRMQIWEKLLRETSPFTVELSDYEWQELAKTELSGGAITNIVNFVLLKANFNGATIRFPLLKEGIIRELRKENRLASL